jgi:hypothetical protein
MSRPRRAGGLEMSGVGGWGYVVSASSSCLLSMYYCAPTEVIICSLLRWADGFLFSLVSEGLLGSLRVDDFVEC